MAITSTSFVVFERLAAAKLNLLITNLNAHIHDGASGTKINATDLNGPVYAVYSA